MAIVCPRRPHAFGTSAELDQVGEYHVSRYRVKPGLTGWACAVERRRFPVGANPTRQPLQPEATGAVTEVTKWLKPSGSVSRYTVTARVCRP
jgi:lipopolysaccharide/colanic/teichoic acid biosynthesis glycosyltransferase